MSKTVYLIRHGIAVERSEQQDDWSRPLTAIGEKKTAKVAQKLVHKQINFDLILTSPLLRAKQTANILIEQGLSSNPLQEFAALAPKGQIETWLDWLAAQSHLNSFALVGHQPDLGHWAEILLWGTASDKLALKKAGIIGIALPDEEARGNCQMFLLTAPKWIL